MTAGAAPATRPAGRARPTGRLARLSLVPPMATGTPRAPFVALVVALLVGGLGALLFLHTALAEDSFRLHDLKVRSALLDDQEQALEQDIELAAAPQRLSARARRLGMVRSENPAFVRLADGRILGKPKAGVAPPPPPTTAAAPTPSATPSATPSGQPSPSGSASPSPATATASPSPAARHR